MIDFLYPGFKKKALTFSYDDGTVQDRRLITIFKRYGIKGTFNLNSGHFGEKGFLENHGGFSVNFDRINSHEVEELYSGMEVAMHTVDHYDLPDIDDKCFDEQVLRDRDTLEALCKKRPCGLAYPCGRYDEHTIERLGLLGVCYARTVLDTYNFALPKDFLAWHPTCHDHDARINELVEAFIRDTSGEMRLFYIWGHSFELDKTDCDRWANMERLCEKLGGRNDIWYATNGEICRYVNAVRSLELESGNVNTSEFDIYIMKDGLPFIWEKGKILI